MKTIAVDHNAVDKGLMALNSSRQLSQAVPYTGMQSLRHKWLIATTIFIVFLTLFNERISENKANNTINPLRGKQLRF